MSLYSAFTPRARVTVWVCTSTEVAKQLKELVGTSSIKGAVADAKKKGFLVSKDTVTHLDALNSAVAQAQRSAGQLLFTSSKEPMKFFSSLGTAQGIVS